MTAWTFIHVADIQVGSPRSFRFAPAWNENWLTARRQINAVGPELVLVGGDLTRDGSLHRYELEAIKADLDAMAAPCHVIPGNMDTGNKHAPCNGAEPSRHDLDLNITAEQLRQFESVFGPSRWSFVHKSVRFSGFCDMLFGSGLAEERQLWQWLEAQVHLPREAHHVWIMHYALFIDDLREANWDIRDLGQYMPWYFGIDEPARGRLFDIFRASGADLVISGHVHCRRTRVVDGIRLDFAPATAFPQFADRWPDGDPALGFTKYEVSDVGIAATFVPLDRVSTKQGYGPGGHPLPEQRDYRLAWEK